MKAGITSYEAKFFPIWVRYTAGGGERKYGADSLPEMLTLVKENAPRERPERVYQLLEQVWQTQTPFYHPYVGNYAVEIGFNYIGQWLEIEETLPLTYQDGLFSEPRYVTSLNVKYQVPIGYSQEEKIYRQKLAFGEAEKAWLNERRLKIQAELLTIADTWIAQQTSSKVKEFIPHVFKKGMNYPPEFGVEIEFDIGGDHETEVFSQATGRGRGIVSQGWYTNSFANPRAYQGEWDEMLARVEAGEFDHVIRKQKKVIPPPARLQK